MKESLDLKLWFLGGPSAWPHELFCPFPLAGPIGTMPGTPLHHFGSELGFLVGPNALPRGLLRVQIGRPSSTLARNPFVITLASPMGLQKPFGPTAWRTMLRQTTAPSPRPSHATPQQFKILKPQTGWGARSHRASSFPLRASMPAGTLDTVRCPQPPRIKLSAAGTRARMPTLCPIRRPLQRLACENSSNPPTSQAVGV